MGSRENLAGIPFVVGDRVDIFGGYEGDPEWLQGDNGYVGTIRELEGKSAVVELDSELNLLPLDGKDSAWRIWGRKLDDPARIGSPRGRWLLLRQGWIGSMWNEPTDRLHVILCNEEPTCEVADLNQVNGAWVESHALMRRVLTT